MPIKSGSLSSAQLKALRATPIAMIAAPGAGYALIVEGVQFWHDAGTAYTVAEDNDIKIRYTDGSGHLFATLEGTGCLDQATDQHRYVYAEATAVTPVENAAIVASMAGAAEITTGTGSLKFRVFFRKIKLGW